MPSLDRLTCPECHTVLKPGKPVAEGKKIKCPKCTKIFVAGAKPSVGGSAGGKAASGKAPASKAPAPAKNTSGDDDEAPGGTYGLAAPDEPAKPPEPPRPKKKKRLRDEDDDDEEEDEDEDDDDEDEEEVDPVLEMYLKQDRSTNPRGPATAIITRPSNYLIVTFGLMALLNIMAATYWILPIIFSDHLVEPKELRKLPEGQDFRKDPKEYEKTWKPILDNESWDDMKQRIADSKTQQVDIDRRKQILDILEDIESERLQERWIQFIFPPLVVIYLCFIVYGAVKLQSLESYPWAWTGVIMALIPVASAGAAWTGLYAIKRLLDIDFDQGDWDTWVWWIAYGAISLWGVIASILALVVMLQPIVKEAFFYEVE